jgi:two-component sensor histidine kinase
VLSIVNPDGGVRPATTGSAKLGNKSRPNKSTDDLIERIIRFSDETPPYSWRALAVAATCVMCATAVRALLDVIGTDIRFATYFPALFVTGVVAGTPAALAAAIGSTAVAYWAFMPPQYQFAGFAKESVTALAIWAGSAGVQIVLTHYCRLALKKLRAGQQEYDTIVKELAHRGRNTYAIIQSIVNQALQDQREAAEKILGRIRAVKFANDLILNQPPHSVFLDAVLAYEFAPYGDDRYSANGPEIPLDAQTARYCVLLIHELVTNAVKHGALASPGGRVEIIWDENGDRLVLHWRESGGPRVTSSEPTRKGFGTELIADCVKALSGKLELAFKPEGFSCTIELAVRKLN